MIQFENERDMATIDERIEALTPSVELLAHHSLENDKRHHARFEQIASTLESLLSWPKITSAVSNGWRKAMLPDATQRSGCQTPGT
jgi:hypothetical protein